jgi:ABC-2 type transport system permease protein
MWRHLSNIYRLGVKELWSVFRDPMLLFLICFVFTAAVYIAATVKTETLHRAPIAIVDEDDSELSRLIALAFYPPRFDWPQAIALPDLDARMDSGSDTFSLVIPNHFERDVLAGRSPTVQVNIDATRISQAFVGNEYVQQIIMGQVVEFVRRYRDDPAPAVDLALRARFNQGVNVTWFASIIEVVNQVTLLSIILAGAALVREREHGTIEHLLVMPVTPAEIMIAKQWSMALVVLVAAALSVVFMVQGFLQVPVQGSTALFLVGVALNLFATTAMGIMMATVARTMPQFGLLMMLTIVPMQVLSGGITPRESMPEVVQNLMLLAPTTHFTELSKAILYRGAGLEVVWKQFAALVALGTVMFLLALARFRKTIGQMA